MALKFNTLLLVYGENVGWEYGGADGVETYSARDQINNGVGSGIPDEEIIEACGISKKDLNFFAPPSKEELAKLDPIYISTSHLGTVSRTMNWQRNSDPMT